MGRLSGMLLVLLLAVTICCGYIHAKVLTNSYLIEFHADTGRDAAEAIAKRHGFVSLGPVHGSKVHYHFVHKRSPRLRTRRDTSIQNRVLSWERSVKRAEQQYGYRRVKRGYKSLDELKKKWPKYEAPADPYFKHQVHALAAVLCEMKVE